MIDARFESDLPEVLATDLDHPEAVCWSPAEERIIAGGEAGQLYSIGLDGSVEERLTIPGANLLGLALDGNRNLYACDASSGRVLKITKENEVLPFGPRMIYPNYPAFDAGGTLWVSDSGSWGADDGRFRGIRPDGSEVVADFGQFSFSNGVAISGRSAFLVTSYDPAVWRIDLDRGERELVVALPRTVPDGIAVDVEGGLWVSCFQPNRIYRLDLDGSLDVILDDWSGENFLSPTNIAFAGEGLKQVVMASLCGRTVRRFDSWVAGRELNYPILDPVDGAS